MQLQNSLTASRSKIATIYRAPEAPLISQLLLLAQSDEPERHAIDAVARQLLVDSERHTSGSWIADVLRIHPLTSATGRALMGLAEAYLRVPDGTTRRRLLREKIGGVSWRAAADVTAPGLTARCLLGGLSAVAQLLSPDAGPVRKSLQKMAMPLVQGATALAMRRMAGEFVFGRDMTEAIRSARKQQATCSFDMLGESACNAAQAERYWRRYREAIDALASSRRNDGAWQHSISIKLSALHSRYETLHARQVVPELIAKLVPLSQAAAAAGIGMTIDAEESERLEMSLDIIEGLMRERSLQGWEGLSVAVQAYQKRAGTVLEWLDGLSRDTNRALGVRLVKGAYWDVEIKRCQERGLEDFPVFTRKAVTDVSYLACARILLRSRLRPAFATHNTLTIATLLQWIGERRDVEFQRLHGMGAPLYHAVARRHGLPCRVYAPVGAHRELLPYLIRRMLENGANTSFVQLSANPAVSAERLLADPRLVVTTLPVMNRAVVTPSALYASRRNSSGLDLSDRGTLDVLAAAYRK